MLEVSEKADVKTAQQLINKIAKSSLTGVTSELKLRYPATPADNVIRSAKTLL